MISVNATIFLILRIACYECAQLENLGLTFQLRRQLRMLWQNVVIEEFAIETLVIASVWMVSLAQRVNGWHVPMTALVMVGV